MVKTLKLGLTLLLITTLIFTLAACGSKSTESQDNTSGKQTSDKVEDKNAQQKSEEKKETIEPLGKYDSVIEISTARAYDDSFKFIEGESIDDNIIYKLYEEDMGIKFTNKWTAKGNYPERLNLAIASNDLPDVFMVTAGQLKELVEGGKLEDLTQLYDKYATKAVKDSFGFQNGVALKMGTVQEKLYGLPETRDAAGNLNLLWLKKDWLDKLNLQSPKTINDVLEIAKAFTKNDPDGNGEQDTFGLMATGILFDSYGLGALDAFAAAFNAYPGKWVKDSSGNLVYGSIQPEMKEVLAKVRELYEIGAIDKEFALKDGGKATGDVVAGKIGMYYAPFWTPAWPLNQAVTKDPNSDWIPVLAPSKSGNGNAVPSSHFTMHWYVVKKGCEHPEAAIKAVNYWYDLAFEGGSRFEKYSELKNNKYKDVVASLPSYCPVYSQPPQSNQVFADMMVNAVKNNDTSKLTSDGKMTYDKIQAGGVDGWVEKKVWVEAAALLKNYEQIVTDEFYGAPTETMNQKQVALNKLTSETFTKIIMGQIPLDEFDTYVTKWKKIGGDDITKEVNEWASQK